MTGRAVVVAVVAAAVDVVAFDVTAVDVDAGRLANFAVIGMLFRRWLGHGCSKCSCSRAAVVQRQRRHEAAGSKRP